MRLLRLIFAVIGSLAAVLAVGTAVVAVVFYTPSTFGRAVGGSVLYAGIAIACFYAFFRLKRVGAQRGFDVVEPRDEDKR